MFRAVLKGWETNPEMQGPEVTERERGSGVEVRVVMDASIPRSPTQLFSAETQRSNSTQLLSTAQQLGSSVQ